MNNLKNKINELNPNQRKIIIGILITLILIASLLIFRMCAVKDKVSNQVVKEQSSTTTAEGKTIKTTTETKVNLDTKISNTTTAGSITIVANTKTDTKPNNTVANTQATTNSTNVDTKVTKPIANNNQPTPKPSTPNKPVVTSPTPKPVVPTPSRPTRPITKPVTPSPKRPIVTRPITKPYYPPTPKPITKPIVTQPKIDEKAYIAKQLGNVGILFKTDDEAIRYGDEKMNNFIWSGYSIYSVHNLNGDIVGYAINYRK